MSISTMIEWIVFLPLAMAVLVGLKILVGGIGDKFAQYLTAGGMVVAAILSGFVFSAVALSDTNALTVVPLMTWIASGDFELMWALRVDTLTAVMLVVVTWVSAVVHVYSIGYMSHDEHKPRFMAYLSLFTFAMLMLVTADNLVQIFFGWEGVGLCSYLLIGFWFKKDSANEAAMKAFLVNRVGDIGLALGVFMVFAVFGTVQFDAIFAMVEGQANLRYDFFGYDVPLLDAMGLLLFVGCMGKSAQLLLHTWLPDAMEGPTPVSALIHAATMVTAGVFLLARMSPLYEFAPFARDVITIVGALTAFFAATVGLVQNDIKRVIAYSTCSQLGYMFFACGIGAYAAAIFHLMTHAFFKALLFLSAGNVIHAVSDEQDMRNMGGIGKMVPITRAYIWIGSLALAGIGIGGIGFAGYYSKDLILESAFAAHTTMGTIAFGFGIAAALLTAFYSWRLIYMTFDGTPRASKEVMDHVHESPKIMWVPLLVLAAGALFSGYMGANVWGMTAADGAFWQGSIFMRSDNLILEHAHHVPLLVKKAPLILGLIGISLAYMFYVKNPETPKKLAENFGGLYRFLLNKWYFDELYDWLFVKPSQWIGKILWKIGDVKIVDGLGPNGAAWMALKGGKFASRVQSGFLYHYAFVMMIGLLGLIMWVVYGGGK